MFRRSIATLKVLSLVPIYRVKPIPLDMSKSFEKITHY